MMVAVTQHSTKDFKKSFKHRIALCYLLREHFASFDRVISKLCPPLEDWLYRQILALACYIVANVDENAR